MLATSEVIALMKALKPRFLEGLTSFEVASIIVPAMKRSFMAHAVIAHEGYPAEHLFLVIHGRARGFCMTPRGEKSLSSGFPPAKSSGERHSCPNPASIL